MDAKLKADWVKALRSGEYEQYIGGIGGEHRAPNKLCCLGVGGRVAGIDAGYASMILTASCIEALGISDEQGGVLGRMNDRSRKSFPEIADYIEQNL